MFVLQNVSAVRLHIVHRADDNLLGVADLLLRATIPLSADERS